MIQPVDNNSINAYINNKMKLSEDKRNSLLFALNKLVQLSYKNSERASDPIVQKKTMAIIDEIGRYYNITRSFINGKGGDIGAFRDILMYFDKQYLENNSLVNLLDQLKQELAHYNKPGDMHDITLNVSDNTRIDSISTNDLELGLVKQWEKMLLYIVEPMLLGFLTDVSEIVLYYDIKKTLTQLIDGNIALNRNNKDYLDFTKSFVYFIELQIKLSRNNMSDNEMAEMMNSRLQQMGFRNLILKSRNIDPGKYREIMAEIINEVKHGESDNTFSVIHKNAVDAIRAIEEKTAAI
jgi:hypothetical protein